MCVSDIRETGNKSFLISHSQSSSDHINAFLAEEKQKRRKQVIEITFNVQMLVRDVCAASTQAGEQVLRYGTGFLFHARWLDARLRLCTCVRVRVKGERRKKSDASEMTKPSKSSYSTN